MKLLHLDCFSGASGDMFLGALVDAGASEVAIRSSLDALGLDGWTLRFSEASRSGLRARRAEVRIDEEETRTYREIRALIENSSLEPSVKELASKTFRLLAEAEARVHGAPIEEVHFHEVGANDAIVDIVGASAAFIDLGAELVTCSAIRTGTGTARTAHGTIPVPGPAVTALLEGAPLVLEGEGELLTPTGAAIIAANVDRFGAPPSFQLSAVGYGAGARDTGAPNLLRVIVGETDEIAADSEHLLIETNLDDMIPELIPHTIERLIAAGAQDAWTSPILMKKGRPALTLSVLALRGHLDVLLDVIYRETTTFGVRIRGVGKDELERTWTTVRVAEHEMRVKLGLREGKVVTASPEFDDAVKVASITGLPLKEVYRRALESYGAPEEIDPNDRPTPT